MEFYMDLNSIKMQQDDFHRDAMEGIIAAAPGDKRDKRDFAGLLIGFLLPSLVAVLLAIV